LQRGEAEKQMSAQRGSTYYVGAAVLWLFVLPIAIVVYLIANALIAIGGVWYVSAGLIGFVVSLFTVTVPYWILLHVGAFDPATVIYLTQSLFGVPLAIKAGALVAPAYRFATAIVLFGISLLLTGATILAEVVGNIGGVSPSGGSHVPWVVAASALLLIGGGAWAVLSVYAGESARRATSAQGVAV